VALTFPLLHMQLLLREAAPHLGNAVVVRFLLRGAITGVLADARAQGTNVNSLPASISALVRGLTRPTPVASSIGSRPATRR
jgi:hypothetical protein